MVWKRFYTHCSRCLERHRIFVIRNMLIFAGTVILFLCNQFFLKRWFPVGFVRGHLNDVLVMGIFLPYTNLLLSLYDRKDVRFRSLPVLLGFALAAGLFWEFAAPLYTDSTSDWYDIIAYLAGALLYFGCMRKKGDGRL